MEKIKVIIPTFYKSENLYSLLRNLTKCELVDEIILVEDSYNLNNIQLHYSHKLNIVKFDGNRRFYNGCVNKGLEVLYNYDYYCLCNDDIEFSTNIFYDVVNFYKTRPNIGIIGMNTTQFDLDEKPLYYGFGLKMGYIAVQGWGTLLFNKKENLTKIPSDLKHWCGDTYMLFYSKYPCYDYYGEKIKGKMSSSTDEYILEIGRRDQEIYEKKYLINNPIWL